MLKKFLYFTILLVVVSFVINISYAIDPNSITPTEISTATNNTEYIDDTIYSSTPDEQYAENPISDFEEIATTTTTEDYKDEAELSVSNIINIILISVGVVLIFLGIAVIIKLK